METYRQRQLAEIGKWLARDGSPASRPPESQELLSAEQSLARIARDAAAARQALPDHEAVQTEAARAVGEATARRNAAHRACILAIVAEHIEQNLVPALKHAQQLERSAWQIHDALDQRADHAGAAEIRTAIHRVKTRQYERAASAAEGRAFSDRLLVDPSAELGSDQ